MVKHRIIVFIMLTLASTGVQAQRPQHQTYGDTMHNYLPSNYYAPWWLYDDWILTSTSDEVHTIDSGGLRIYVAGLGGGPPALYDSAGYFSSAVLRGEYTSRPINIIGLAGASVAVGPGQQELDTTILPEEFLLYDATPHGLQWLASAQWQPYDSCRYLQLDVPESWDWRASLDFYIYGTYPDDACEVHGYNSYTAKIREYYFDKPIRVEDSFYVGGTDRTFAGRYVVRGDSLVHEHVIGAHSLYLGFGIGPYEQVSYGPPSVLECPTHYFPYRMVDNILHPNTNIVERPHAYPARFFLLVFPIYEDIPRPEDSAICPRPTGLSCNPHPDLGMAEFFWNSSSCYRSYELGCAPVGADFDSSATIIALPGSTGAINGLTIGQDYIARVRGVCKYYDETVRSQWSDPVVFSMDTTSNQSDTLWLNDSTYVLGGDTIVIPHDGIWEVSDSGNQISVFPNPTTGDVTVDCGGMRVEQIELLDLQGRVLLREEPDAASFKLPTSTLSPGAYLIRVHTAEGVFYRRIVKSE